MIKSDQVLDNSEKMLLPTPTKSTEKISQQDKRQLRTTNRSEENDSMTVAKNTESLTSQSAYSIRIMKGQYSPIQDMIEILDFQSSSYSQSITVEEQEEVCDTVVKKRKKTMMSRDINIARSKPQLSIDRPREVTIILQTSKYLSEILHLGDWPATPLHTHRAQTELHAFQPLQNVLQTVWAPLTNMLPLNLGGEDDILRVLSSKLEPRLNFYRLLVNNKLQFDLVLRKYDWAARVAVTLCKQADNMLQLEAGLKEFYLLDFDCLCVFYTAQSQDVIFLHRKQNIGNVLNLLFWLSLYLQAAVLYKSMLGIILGHKICQALTQEVLNPARNVFKDVNMFVPQFNYKKSFLRLKQQWAMYTLTSSMATQEEEYIAIDLRYVKKALKEDNLYHDQFEYRKSVQPRSLQDWILLSLIYISLYIMEKMTSIRTISSEFGPYAITVTEKIIEQMLQASMNPELGGKRDEKENMFWHDCWMELIKLISLFGEDAQALYSHFVNLFLLVNIILPSMSLLEKENNDNIDNIDVTFDYEADQSDVSLDDNVLVRVTKYRKTRGALPSYRIRFNGFPWRNYIPPLPQFVVETSDEDSDDYYSISYTKNHGPSQKMLQARKRVEEQTMSPSSDNSDVPLSNYEVVC